MWALVREYYSGHMRVKVERDGLKTEVSADLILEPDQILRQARGRSLSVLWWMGSLTPRLRLDFLDGKF